MNKDNIFKSSSFYMSEGDVLHLLFRDESGTAVQVTLNSLNDDADTPEAPTALAASDITSSGFVANWYLNENSLGYYLDVAIDSGFTSMVAGYDNLDVGDVSEYTVTGLTGATTYFYRLRAYNDNGTSTDSNTVTTDTTAGAPLVDLDGNVYTTVVIGLQTWLVENFRCEKYADGTAIPEISTGEYDDWFLPSYDELNQMYVNLKLFSVGGFADAWYFSSSEYNASYAYAEQFYGGNMQQSYYKYATIHVRACRSFVDIVGAYALRDTGPAGGLIFYIDGAGTTYYEAAPSDQSASQAWSNVIDVEIGATAQGTAIGTGQANTTAIIGQVGHTDSAAKICNDFSVSEWALDTVGAHCYYDNNEATYKARYGALYNYHAITNAHGFAYLERGGVQEAGWRVPTDADWWNLVTDGISDGGRIKDNESGLWLNPNTGATNETGFTALPAGIRDADGIFERLTEMSSMWESDAANRWSAVYNVAIIYTDGTDSQYGASVRLVKDS